MRIGKDFLSLYDVIPTLCNDNKPEMSLRDYRKSKVFSKLETEQEKKSFEISTVNENSWVFSLMHLTFLCAR